MENTKRLNMKYQNRSGDYLRVIDFDGAGYMIWDTDWLPTHDRLLTYDQAVKRIPDDYSPVGHWIEKE